MNRKVVYYTGGTALILFIGAVTMLILNTVKLSHELNDEKLQKELLISEKIQLKKSVDIFTKEVSNLKSKNKQLDQTIEDTRLLIEQKQNEITRLLAENKNLVPYKKKSAELIDIKTALDLQIAELGTRINDLFLEKSKISDQMAQITEERNALLNEKLVPQTYANHFRTEAQSGRNSRLTVIARRTNKLNIFMEVPPEIESDINFKIETPEGKQFSSRTDFAARVNIHVSDVSLMASNEGLINATSVNKKVEMVYELEKPLKKGIYQFHVYSGDKYLGSVQMRLK